VRGGNVEKPAETGAGLSLDPTAVGEATGSLPTVPEQPATPSLDLGEEKAPTTTLPTDLVEELPTTTLPTTTLPTTTLPTIP
jgi:hypothetical protein